MSSFPLIVTLGFDKVTFTRLDSLRKHHFPPDRNWIPAHLSLFHQWPGEEPEVALQLAQIASRHKAMALHFVSPRKMGNGVCLPVVSSGLMELHSAMKRVIGAGLIPQDRQAFRPHITLQNKVSQETVAATLASMMRGYEDWFGMGTHLCLWRYLGGPWEEAGKFEFGNSCNKPAACSRLRAYVG